MYCRLANPQLQPEGRISKFGGLNQETAHFPLTPTLSLGERESPLAVGELLKSFCANFSFGFLDQENKRRSN
jgi:hypothetical protein